MAKKTATATKIKSEPMYEYGVTCNGVIEIIFAENYRNFGDEDAQLDFFVGDDNVASFRKWDYVIRGAEVTSSLES